MTALFAEFRSESIDGDTRREPRRSLKLVADARGLTGDTRASIHNLSRAGMLLETPVALGVREIVEVDLPEAGRVSARVIWTRGTLAGCSFVRTLPQSAVSAALLLGSPDPGHPVRPPWRSGDARFDSARSPAPLLDLLMLGAAAVLALATLMLLGALLLSSAAP